MEFRSITLVAPNAQAVSTHVARILEVQNQRPEGQVDEAAVWFALSFTMVLTKSSPALYEDRTCNNEMHARICLHILQYQKS